MLSAGADGVVLLPPRPDRNQDVSTWHDWVECVLAAAVLCPAWPDMCWVAALGGVADSGTQLAGLQAVRFDVCLAGLALQALCLTAGSNAALILARGTASAVVGVSEDGCC
jgi:hypothetical protein